MSKWEYKTLIESDNYHLRKAMNRLGRKGWEAYSVLRIDYLYDSIYVAYLKRAKRTKRCKCPAIELPAISLN